MASLWHKFITAGDPSLNQPQVAEVGETQVAPNEKEPIVAGDGHTGEETVPDSDAQRGVQKVQAVTLAWTKGSLIALLSFIWLLFLTNGFRISILYTLAPFVTSEWAQHSLTTVISIVADSMTAACYIPIAKMLDVWGRAESFLVMVGFSTLGLVLMAASHNLATFCAAQVFYQVGFGGVIYTICVLAADATNLRNRGLAFAFTSSPYMITAFAGPKAAEKFYVNINWRWGFGAFAIILPIVATPLYFVLRTNLKKAEKMGLFVKESSGRTWIQQITHGVVEYDLLGVFLFGGGFTTFLLPFTLATSAPNGWKTDYIIAMIVTGFVVVIIFVLWEMFWSPVPFLNKRFLTDRTVIAACLIDMTYQMSYYCWASYFSSFLMVVNNLTIAEAGYVGNTFSVVSGVLLFIVGYGIRRTGYYKWLFWLAVPLYIFALGLMIHFRTPNGKIGYIVMCEIFISMGGAVFILCMQLAVLAAVDHQHVAAALATLFVAGSIGGAIGNTISGTIWTNTFLPALYRYMPESAAESVPLVYASVVTQLSYPVGSEERLGIQKAYGYAQTRMLAAGTGLMVLSFVWTYMLKNINVSKMSQTRGTVF
ncbi:major facilitator superfamily domain-containing protein [Dactylonectria macrodidyma]|uniref:Major facilitator superfamily domain-containing protein n=1 Tax=Dactylonectria macrodidyma TaxID=307937 RepID=A0A9P9EGT7_9HYPO|nr:major facilitator superfamily domain-containing protein [Dactylonectria macrodidyma]